MHLSASRGRGLARGLFKEKSQSQVKFLQWHIRAHSHPHTHTAHTVTWGHWTCTWNEESQRISRISQVSDRMPLTNDKRVHKLFNVALTLSCYPIIPCSLPTALLVAHAGNVVCGCLSRFPFTTSGARFTFSLLCATQNVSYLLTVRAYKWQQGVPAQGEYPASTSVAYKPTATNWQLAAVVMCRVELANAIDT